MIDNIWDYLNIWIRHKFKQVFTTDGAGDTAIRVVGDLETTTDAPNTEEVINFNIAAANTEYTINLPTNTKRYTLYFRGSKKLALAYNLGETATNYLTVNPGETHDSGRLDYSGVTPIYVSSSSINILEIKVQRRL